MSTVQEPSEREPDSGEAPVRAVNSAERALHRAAISARAGWARSRPIRRTWRRRVYEILELGHGEDRASKLCDTFLVTLILLNIAAFVAETVPEIANQHHSAFHAFEIFSVAIFTIEYGLRIWTAVEVPFLSRLNPWAARLRFAGRPSLIIDFLAIAPFFLGSLIGVDLRALRALRLLRFFKLSRYSPAMHSLIRVLVNERRALVGAGLLLMTAVLFASTGIYYLESAAQPDRFGSVPQSAWWAIATLTTVGYGDVTPVTTLGRTFGAVVMVVGLCILALPVAIIAAGFSQEVNRRDFVVTWSLMSRIPLLANLDAEDVEQIMPLFHAHNLPPNFEVLAEGGEGHAMYFIAAGKVTMRSAAGDQSYGKGDCFGVTAVLDHDTYKGSFVTTTRCRLLKLHREDFHRLETASPEVARSLRKTAQQQATPAAAG